MRQKKHLPSNYTEHLTDLIKKDDIFVSEYLNQALEESISSFLVALRKVASAKGGLSKLSTKSSIARQSLYRMCSETGNPSLTSLSSVLNNIGLSLEIKPKGAKNGRNK